MEDKLGLVLSGGGAKGAYQVGILKYLAEVGLQPDEVSGTSIGALNASVISANKDIRKSSPILEGIWKRLAETPPLILDNKKLVSSSAVLLNLVPALRLNPLLLGAKSLFKASQLAKDIYAEFSGEYKNSDSYKKHRESKDSGVLQSAPLVDLLSEYASSDRIKNGLPLYVGLYKSDGSLVDLMNYAKALAFGSQTKDSQIWHTQTLPEKNIHEAIMASAALPFLFQSRAIGGVNYRDGGMGGAFEEQGNTPIQPLVDSGCKYIIVSLLSDGSTFDRYKYSGCTIIEVRPKDFISNSIMRDLIAFEPDKIKTWMEQGYVDAKRCIGNVTDALIGVKHLEDAERKRESVLDALDKDNFKI